MPDLPEITSEAHLIDAIPRAKTSEQRAHLHKHAHALGVPHHIPQDWNADGSLKDKEAE
ncbi:MAG: hypothetical protein ACRDQU_00910 [Pseudonocardiaceae bacterium]